MRFHLALLLTLTGAAACAPSPLTPIEERPRDASAMLPGEDAGEPADGGANAPDAGFADAGAFDAAPAPDAAAQPDAGPPDTGVEPPVPACSIDLTPRLNALRVPGLSAGVIKGGRLVCTAVAGSANIENNRPVTPDTVFAWASTSKAVTAVAAMILHEQGAFGLDDDIDNYLPFSTRNPNCPGDPITFRQLLTHSSSIIDNDDIYDETYTIGDSPIALGDFVRGYVVPGGAYYDEENFDSDCPGEVNDYSNVAVGLLGHIVAHISGMPFDQFCRQHIFTPLGMNEASFHLAGLDVTHIAMPYEGRPGNFSAAGHIGFATYPDGLLRTSVPQMARFLAMMSQLGQYNGTRILAEATVREMARVQIPALDDTQGLIWFYSSYGTRSRVLGHDGSDPGTSSLMFYDPADGTGALLVANGDWYNRNDDSPEADALLGELFTEAQRY